MSQQSLNLTIQNKQVNWKAIVFWGLTIGLLGTAIYLYRQAIFAFITSIPTRFSNFQLPDFSGFLNGIVDYINKNPLALIGVAASLCTAGIALISKIKAKKQTAQALLEKTQFEQLSTDKILQLQQQNSDYKTKYEEVLKGNSQDALLEAQNLVQTQKQTFEVEKAKLLGQVEALQQQVLLKDTKVIEKTVVK